MPSEQYPNTLFCITEVLLVLFLSFIIACSCLSLLRFVCTLAQCLSLFTIQIVPLFTHQTVEGTAWSSEVL